MGRRRVWAILAMCICLMAVGCRSGFATPTADPVSDLEGAVRAEIEARLAQELEDGLHHYEVLDSGLQGDGQFGSVESLVVLDSCPLFSSVISYNAAVEDGTWVLYNDQDTLPNLFKLWATARSAALAGETVVVPGTEGLREVSLIPDAMPELLRARLDGFSSRTVDPLVGFFLCNEEEVAWDELGDPVEEELRQLIPEVREIMRAALAEEIGAAEAG